MPKENTDFREENDRLEYEERVERKQARDAARQSAANARQQGMESIKKQAAAKADAQSNCPHMKPMNAGSAIAGQHDHKGIYHWICQYCHKEWEGSQLPPHLRIDMALVGGPSH